MSKTIENLKSGNYEVVDNQGVSVTEHFIYCLEKELADLEAKLAESEEESKARYKDWQEEIRACDELRVVLAEVRKQLAEKEEVIMELASKVDLLESEKENLFRTLEEANEDNQDKISFALEQLEKVKAELEFTSNNNEWITARDDKILNGICDFIDNQIKAIKGREVV